MTSTRSRSEAIESVLAALRDMFRSVQEDNEHLRKENASLWESVEERDEKLRIAYEQLRDRHDQEEER